MRAAGCSWGLQKLSILARYHQAGKKRRWRHLLREPSAVTALATAAHGSVGLNYSLPVWGLDTEPGEDTSVLPAESASPASLLLRKAADSAVCLSPLLGPSPLSLALQHLPQFGLSHLHLAATQIQNVLSILCKPLLCACSSPSLGQSCLCSAPRGAPPAPHSSRLAFCRHPLLVLSCSF